MKGKDNKLWGGAFVKTPRKDVIDYCAGYDAKAFAALDEMLLPYDVQANEAHAEMLHEQGYLDSAELTQIRKALAEARQHPPSLNGFEDVHSAVEAFVTARTPAGEKLHSGRSRNDLVACDTRLLMRDKAAQWQKNLVALADALEKTARNHEGTPMPGYSHHQTAVPFTYARWLQAYAVAFRRDAADFAQWMELYDECPLGACAGFGTRFKLAPESTAKKLGFSKPFSNSLDAVQQRWESEASLVFRIVKAMNHLSQLAQTYMVLSMPGQALFALPEEFCTGSSVMPHKKNPDFLEVTKAKASVAQASLVQLCDVGKSAFTGYNRDSQWTKKALMHALVECEAAPGLMAEFVAAVKPDAKKLAALCEPLVQTEKAEKLAIEKGIPFRQAKRLIEAQIRKDAESEKGPKP